MQYQREREQIESVKESLDRIHQRHAQIVAVVVSQFEVKDEVGKNNGTRGCVIRIRRIPMNAASKTGRSGINTFYSTKKN